MKARARENLGNNGQNGMTGSATPIPGSLRFQSDLDRRSGGKGRHGDDEQLSVANARLKAELETQIPVTFRCLSAVSGVDESVLLLLLEKAVIRKFKQKESVLRPVDSDQHIHLVLDGVVTLHTYTENGRQIINDYLGRGYFFGEVALTDPDNPDFWANSKGGCSIASIPRDHFLEVGMSNPTLLRVLTDQLIRRLRSADHKARDLAFLDVSGRVANALRELAKGPCAITHPDGMQIRMTRQEIGLIVGCSREMVGRAIKMLADEGEIEVNGKNIVVRGTR